MRIDREHRLVVVHVLSTDTPEAILQELKTRYEKPLLQLFAS
jgi:multisubunit Na+/H+ antiporter MnhE subunit